MQNSSRIIVKNLPNYLALDEFRKHFSQKGEVTDAKIMRTATGKSRNFGFIGYRTEEEARLAVEYFNKTFINTHRLEVDYARPYGDKETPVSRSKHSRLQSVQKEEDNKSTLLKEQEEKQKAIAKKRSVDLEQFLEIMKPRASRKVWQNDDIQAGQNGAEEDIVVVPIVSKEGKDDDLYEDLPSGKLSSDTDGAAGDGETTAVDNANDTLPPSDNQPQSGEESEKEDATELEKKHEEAVDTIMDTGRLFVRNLNFSCTEEELKEYFAQFGPIAEVHIPLDKVTKRCRGYGYVLYVLPENALQAYSELDNKIFQGRLLHVLPGKERPVQQDENLTDFQRKKQERLKADAKKESSWNSLFMSQDAIADAMANKLSVQKGELLDADQGDLAVRMALAETHIIQETTEFLKEHGVCVDAFKANMKKERSDTVILVKNIPFRTSEHELHELFSRCGDIIRLVLPPTRTIALVEYSNGNEVKAAFSQLAFKNFHGKPLLLEKAPIGVFTCKAAPKEEKNEADETVATEPTTPLSDSAAVSLFVKNLSFETKKEALAELFSRVHGFRSAVISTKKDAKTGNTLSMGFGFVEYDNIEHANQAIKLFQNTLLDGHALQIKLSDRKSSSADKSSQDSGKEIKAKSSKLLIRNVPFEATKKDLMTLFGSFGQIKRLRMPKKYDNKTHRGFAFVDYLTKQEAKLAFENLSSTHLYGRHLVIEWAEDDESVDAIRDKTRKLFNADAPSAKRKFEFLEGDNNNQDELEE